MKKLWTYYSDLLGRTIFHPQYLMNISNYEIVRVIEDLKVNKGKLIDIGSGRMQYKDELLKYIEIYHSLDHPEISKYYDKKHNPDYLADISKKTKLKDSFYDVVLMTQVLEYIENPQNAFKEINRVLKKGGTFIITSPFLYPIHDKPYDLQRFTDQKIVNLLNNTGFKNIKVVTYGNTISTNILLIQVALFYSLMQSLKSRRILITILLLCLISISLIPLNIIGLLANSKSENNESNFVYNYLITAKKS